MLGRILVLTGRLLLWLFQLAGAFLAWLCSLVK